ncbi:hypothetical protein [Hymenobacter psoromatis]|uniref:hypothetical protein n=1 Tax=Hymenobacter psoromatis TaxID=1484116 RepID=UPI001CBD8A7F|nr:hypothetical protein [Hymenobacter psoromatis]
MALFELQMPQSTPNASGPSQTANAELAAQIVVALRNSEFIKASDESVAVTLLTMGNPKLGDWRRLLEKNLPAISTTINTDHAAAHHAA